LKTDAYFMPYQTAVIFDEHPLVIVEKGRQIGLSYGVSYKAVRLAAGKQARMDVFVMSRDEMQAKQFLLYCKRWARVLKFAAEDLGEVVVDHDKNITAHVLRFANGLCIYCLSSNPDAIVGKSGHVILDEFALHKDQRGLYAVAKPVIQWGGTLTIISTHRGVNTVFNTIITDINQRGNKMGWSLHTIPIQKAVDEGIVEKINAATGRNDTREDWLARQRAECLDEEQWQQEYCCIPADESTAFISYEMIRACQDDTARVPNLVAHIKANAKSDFFLGFDVARSQHLSVIDCEEKVGDVIWERGRMEMRGKTFAEQETVLSELLNLPNVRRCCIDATGLGKQIAERMQERFGYRVEPVNFTAQIKSDLAWHLRRAHEDIKLRYNRDELLVNDLRGIKKSTTSAGNERFEGETGDSHCDRFWAKALAVEAGNTAGEGIGAMVG
jgi:phage FluMu gp28-like protein